MARRSLTPRHMAVRVRMARRKTVASVLALLLRPAAELRGADQGGFPERHTDSHCHVARTSGSAPREVPPRRRYVASPEVRDDEGAAWSSRRRNPERAASGDLL